MLMWETRHMIIPFLLICVSVSLESDICMWVHMYVQLLSPILFTYRSLMSTPSVFLYTPSYFWRQSLSVNPEITGYSVIPWDLLVSVPPTLVLQTHSSPGLYVSAGNPNPGYHVYAASTLPNDPSPHSLCLIKKCLLHWLLCIFV